MISFLYQLLSWVRANPAPAPLVLQVVHVEEDPERLDIDVSQWRALTPGHHHLAPEHVAIHEIKRYMICWRQPGAHANIHTPLRKLLRRGDWPIYRSLIRPPGTRLVQRVAVWDMLEFTDDVVHAFLDSIPDDLGFPIGGQQTRIRLADAENIITYDGNDLAFFARIDGEREMCELMESYILRTVAEVVRILDSVQNPSVGEMAFENISESFLAHNAMWQVYALENFSIVHVSPWSLSHDDLMRFATERPLLPGEVDNCTESPSDKITNKLLALLCDVCAPPRGNMFAITNYNYWCFGYFSPDRRVLHVTVPIAAPIDCLARNMLVQGGPKNDINALQVLVFWIQISRLAFPGLRLDIDPPQ